MVACITGFLLTGAIRAESLSPSAIVGEYSGKVLNESRSTTKVGVQIKATESEGYIAIGYLGGLPGDGWNGDKPVESSGRLENGKIHFKGDIADVIYDDGTLTVIENGGKIEIGTLDKTIRKSPTLSTTPPENAVILTDGKANGVLPHETQRLHLEFQLNSDESSSNPTGFGVLKIGNQLELRISDSFCHLVGPENCGSLGKQSPKVNACLPPDQWQTLDLEFGPSMVKILLNGIEIHQDVPWAPQAQSALNWDGEKTGTRFRNIWHASRSSE
ncbi:MAG TPA: DUF1080 domain-containing protein [Planctomicrobium sp.]|nr:DUF1080 domain-containing protein [Planctomicrobium sp.]